MRKQEQNPLQAPGALRYSDLAGKADQTQSLASTRIEDALDEGLDESFPASDPVAIDTRPPEQGHRMRAGRRAIHVAEISCVVEYDTFVIELNAEQRSSGWFPEFQILKDGLVVVPWLAPTVPASGTKKIAIEVAAERAMTDIRGGLAAAFC